MTMIGAALLWVGWFGFNAGSALRADGYAALSMMNTFVAAAAGALSWMMVELLGRGKPSLLGLVTGLLAGLVVVTPGAGYVGPMGALLLGVVSGAACYWFCTRIKTRFQYDDSLDVFGVHCVAGVIGTLAVGILANPALGGVGILDYIAQPGKGIVAVFDVGAQLWAQFKAVVVTLIWSGYVSARLYTITDMAVGLRPDEDEEHQGLDVVDHGERAYNY
jgi:Amt family ammonium transporter